MIVYHEITPTSLHSTLQNGLKCTSRGAKGNDPLIAKADAFLDANRPQHLKDQHVSRCNNSYAYLPVADGVVDITSGKVKDSRTFTRNSDQITLLLTIDPQYCFVSDLDLFDAVKQGIDQSLPQSTLQTLAQRYWNALTCLADYTGNLINRPEVMIPYDIPASKISVAG